MQLQKNEESSYITLIDLDPTNKITLAGLPGTGKTTLSKFLAAFFASQEGTEILIYDVLGQYKEFKDEQRYLPKSDSPAEFESVCKRLCTVSNHMFIIEEADTCLREGYLSGTYAFILMTRGRNWGNGMLAVTQRIQDLAKKYFQRCQHCFFFRCHPMVKDYVKGFLDPEAIRLLFSLKQYNFLYYNMETHQYGVFVLDLTGFPHIEKGKQREPIAEEGKVDAEARR